MNIGKKSKIATIIVSLVVMYKFRKKIFFTTITIFKFFKELYEEVKKDISNRLTNFSWSSLMEDTKINKEDK